MNEKLYIYIDESGDTGYTKRSTKYFMLTALTVDDIFILRRIAKRVHKGKKDNKKENTLHAHRETNRIRGKLIQETTNLNIKCTAFVLNKKEKYIEDPYFYLLEKLAKYFYKSNINQIILAKRETRGNYNQKIINLFKSHNIDLYLSRPIDEKSLQIADFYSWVVFVYIEYDQSDYFKQLEHQINLI